MNTFEDFWNLYDLKKSREKVERKWHLMSAKDQQACMNSLPSYIKSTPNREFRKHPSTYLNQKCWQDTIYKETEEKQVYRTPKDKPVSTYEPKEFDRAKGIRHLKKKLNLNFENGTPIRDYGGVYQNLLKEFIDIPTYITADIVIEANKEKNRPRNRFEEPYKGDINSNIRHARLNWQLNTWRSEGRNISLEI